MTRDKIIESLELMGFKNVTTDREVSEMFTLTMENKTITVAVRKDSIRIYTLALILHFKFTQLKGIVIHNGTSSFILSEDDEDSVICFGKTWDEEEET